MKVKCSRARLSEAFSVASMVVPQRAAVPALMNARMTAAKGPAGPSLEVAVTDLEFGIRLSVPAEVAEEGVLVVPAARMGGILRESSEEDVALHSDGSVASVRLDGAAFKLVGADPADFPQVPEFDEASAASVAADELGEMIRKTRFAVSNEGIRYALTGQLFEIKGGEVRMVASDGKRLAYAKSVRRKKEGDHRDIRAVVPTKAMDLLEKVLGEDDDRVSLNVEETQIRMRTRSAMIHSRLIEGHFPEYEAIVPADPGPVIAAPPAALLGAVRKAALMTTDKTRAVKFTMGGGKCVLFTRTQDVGEASIEFPLDYKGKTVEVVFNPDYVADYLKSVTDPVVDIHLRDRTSAAVFRAGKDYVYVLMPLSIAL